MGYVLLSNVVGPISQTCSSLLQIVDSHTHEEDVSCVIDWVER